MSSGGESNSRRLSRPDLSGISAIFNPKRKLRRDSSAVSQILDDNSEPDLFGESCGMANGPNSQDRSGNENSGGGGVIASSSSVPLLGNIQQNSMDGGTGGGGSLSHGQHGHGSNNNRENKPLAKTTFEKIRRAIFSKTSRKLLCGVFLSLLVAVSWNICIHSIKHLYKINHLYMPEFGHAPTTPEVLPPTNHTPYRAFDPSQVYQYYNGHLDGSPAKAPEQNYTNLMPNPSTRPVFDAPFFTGWLLTMSTVLYYPIHQLTVRFCSCMGRKGPKGMSRAVSDAIQGFRERGMTFFQFLGRCSGLSLLIMLTNWTMFLALRNISATTLLALIATTTSFSYLLSWVVLHQTFVGIRIFAVILSNMGIALFAYMDGYNRKTATVWAVILGACSACSSAVFKVVLKKSFGIGATISQQVALIFSGIGILAIIIFWPLFTIFYFTGVEVIEWTFTPWLYIILAILASLTVNLLDSFGVTCTFESFITLGLLLAVPGSAMLDQWIYKIEYEGMGLAAIITICIGFCIVILPEDWPSYITKLIRRRESESPEAHSRSTSHFGTRSMGGQGQGGHGESLYAASLSAISFPPALLQSISLSVSSSPSSSANSSAHSYAANNATTASASSGDGGGGSVATPILSFSSSPHRCLAQIKHKSRWGRQRHSQAPEPPDLRTGHIRSHLRSPSGRVR